MLLKAKNSKIVLTLPPISMEARYGKISNVGSTIPSLGLAYLASYIKRCGYLPYLIEPAAFRLSYNDVMDKIRSINPAYIGISSVTGTIYNAAKLAEMVKNDNPGIVTILGGPHITAVPHETMDRFRHFDIGVIGEGEATLGDLLGALNSDKDIDSVQGIIFRDKDGKTKVTRRREFIKDLDTLPMPAWDLIPDFPNAYNLSGPLSARKPEGSIITSRGCPHECIFCDRSVFGRNYRLHSADYVLENFRILKEKYKVRHIMVYDDTFMAAKKRLFDICERLIKTKNNAMWSCFGNVKVDYETLKLMKRAGCWQIGFGIESGSNRILKQLKKRQTVEDIKRAIILANKARIRTRGLCIIGSPGETYEDIKKTINLSMEIPLQDLQLTNFTPFPGSEAYTIADQYGKFDKRWDKMNMLEPIFISNGLTKEGLVALQNYGHRKFYTRPRVVLSYIGFGLSHPRIFVNMYNGLLVLLKMFFADLFMKLKRLHKP